MTGMDECGERLWPDELVTSMGRTSLDEEAWPHKRAWLGENEDEHQHGRTSW